MDILDFLGLEEAKYWEVFEKRSKFLYEYSTIDAVYELYAIDGFYVELTYSPDFKILQAVNPFKNGARLDKYLDEFEFKPYPGNRP